MNNYQTYIAKSRYSRYLPDKHRREHWDETVKRYFDFMEESLKTKNGYDISVERPLLEKAVVDLEVMPSMRALMTSGKALERSNVAAFNPVRGDTLVLTKEYGEVPIRSIVDQDVTLVNINGDWTDGHISGYGEQGVYEVLLKLNSHTEHTVYCTANHRWVFSDGTVKSTLDLLPKDHIPFMSAPKANTDNIDYRRGVQHGLVYGDGTAVKSCERVKGYTIRLCGEKNKELLPWFDEYPVTYPLSANGDPIVMMYDGFAATHSLKELPAIEETDSYLLGFIRGWMAADGFVTKAGSQVTICVSGQGKEWLEKYASKIGFVIQRTYKQKAETNYGKRRQDSYVVYFSRSSCIHEDFLCSWKRDVFKPLESSFTVVSIKETSQIADVYCAEVPDTNTFVLHSGIVTGNCSYLPVDDPKAFDEAMYVLLCGTGVGFSVENKYVNKLPEVPERIYDSDTVIAVSDSKEGWAKALRQLISLLYAGEAPKWDVSKVRPAGAKLKTFGGRASGPEPLVELFKFTVLKFKGAVGRKLHAVECHDIMCKIGEVVVVGGVVA